MLDVFPKVFATLKADTYFATTLSGFEDSAGNFKLFEENEAPSDASVPFITVEISPGGEDQRTKWATQYAMFHVWGSDKDWTTLFTIANQIADIFQAVNCFSDGSHYVTVGEAVFDKGEDPVTELVSVSVGIRFGIED